MRILFLTPQLPFPPRQGTQIRNYHLLRAAAGEHEVDLVSFARQGEEVDESSPLRELCGQVKLLPAPHRSRRSRLRNLAASPEPDMAHRLPSAGFAATLRAMAETGRYEAIQVEGIEMARYLPMARAAAPRAALVFDDHNAEHLLQARAAAVDARRPPAWPRALYSLVQSLKLRRYEARVCRNADAVLAVSDRDAESLRRLGLPARPWVVPNGVDTDYYRPAPPDSDDAGRPSPAEAGHGGYPSPGPEEPAILFTGTMDYRPNVDAMIWFVSAVLPLVVTLRPEVKLYIVGRSPAPAVSRLAERDRRVVVTGPLDDVRPYFARSTAFVVPLRMAGGVRLKILESLAMGVPVVSTRVGAEGTDLADGTEILLADSPRQFAASLLALLDDPVLRYRLAVAGRQAAEQRFDWRHVAPRLLEVYREMAGRNRLRGGSL